MRTFAAPKSKSAPKSKNPSFGYMTPAKSSSSRGAPLGNQARLRKLAGTGNLTSLRQGLPNDRSEIEADRIADQTVRAPGTLGALAPRPPIIARPGGEPEKAGGLAENGVPDVVYDVLRRPGQPLEPPIRARYEALFGRAFGDVRLHVDAEAAAAADAVDARAFTVGRDIVFGRAEFAPRAREGAHLLAHELTHVVQQFASGPLLQRAPKNEKSKDDGAAAKTYPQYQVADRFSEVSRDNDTWMLTVEGASDAEYLLHVMWPRLVPPSIQITLVVAITEPFTRGWFKMTGLSYDTLQLPGSFAMEPSVAKLFIAHGLEDEKTESSAVKDARAAFRKAHDGHQDAVLDHIDHALQTITKRNPDLMIAYYRYYQTHDLKDDDSWGDGINYDSDRMLGATARGNTVINKNVLLLYPPKQFPTDDPFTLLSGTLIHEYTHTPQPTSDPVSAAQFEAKAYGIEILFMYRMGNKARADFIERRYTDDQLDRVSNGDKIFLAAQNAMTALYRMIDNGGPAAIQARKMSVELISKNAADFGPELKAFLSKIPDGRLIP
ncbi:DUF4157 domain-containing protein [Reyranella sp.]|uniref:eCIS core domain-containing protein n=1 Tax=Reyranella sp. TaxID=1929291 RepID=UPI003D13D751